MSDGAPPVPPSGLEPPRPFGHRPSTCRVYLFRHGGMDSGVGKPLRSIRAYPGPRNAELLVVQSGWMPSDTLARGEARMLAAVIAKRASPSRVKALATPSTSATAPA